MHIKITTITLAHSTLEQGWAGRWRRALLWLLFALPLAGLAGCSSVPSYGTMPQVLSIQVLPNQSKQFMYRVGQAAQIASGTLVRAPRYVPDRRDYEKLQRRTAYVVAATGYCRNGYMELDFRLNMQQQWLRGECKESATESDIAAFADRASLPLDNLEE